MDKRLGNSIKLMVCLLIVMGGFVSSSQESQTPHFDNTIAVLELPGNQLVWDADLSPQGNFVYTHAAFLSQRIYPREFLGASQYLWDIGNIEATNNIIYLEPIRQITLYEMTEGYNRIFAIQGLDRMFSPDGQYLAVGLDAEVQVLTVPDLISYRILPANTINPELPYARNRMNWSEDSRFLALLLGHEIVVWDVENNSVKSQALKYQYEKILYLGGKLFGLISSREQDAISGFFVCESDLKHCSEQELPYWHPSIRPSPDGQLILVTPRSDCPSDEVCPVEFWQIQSNGQYQQIDRSFNAKDSGYPHSFSPDGRILATEKSDTLTLRDFSNLSQIHALPHREEPTWLPDSTHFITFSYRYETDNPILILKLYRLGREQPLDVINLVDIFGEDIISEWWQGDATLYANPDVSSDGQQILFNLGFATLAMTIVYE
jgi:WD40 repeat protein